MRNVLRALISILLSASLLFGAAFAGAPVCIDMPDVPAGAYGRYVYTQPLTALDIASVTSDCDATIKFTAGAGLSGIELPSSCYFTGESAFTSGAHYFAAFNGADVVVIEQQKLDEA